MRWRWDIRLTCLLLSILLLTAKMQAVAKVHVIAFGKWTPAQWTASVGENNKLIAIKIRTLIVDGRVKEYTIGAPHEVTERLFVVRRAFRVNDSLPEEANLRWEWQRGGWLLVDRVTGRISPINLPEFDAYYSAASWYRDYAAYCGVADDGKQTFAIVAQISRRKPVLKKSLNGAVAEDAAPDSICPAPTWQRGPMRVTFEPAGVAKQTFSIRGHLVDAVNDDEEEE